MDRDPAYAIGPAASDRPSLPDLDLLPTRRAARDRIRSALVRERGLVAVTGDPGVGKTTLWRTIQAARGPGESWVAVEVTPRGGPHELYRLIARGLRVEPAGFGRAELLDFLAEKALSGERWTLVVDEAQNLDAEAMEAIRVLSNRLGEPDGFASILLVGQTGLARRFVERAGAAIASRIAAHVHLRPLDAQEVEGLLRGLDPSWQGSESQVDRIHLATGGLPARVARWARPAEPRPAVVAPLPARIEAPPPRDAPLIGPAKPPIREEEGLIEVGWSPDAGPSMESSADLDAVDREPIQASEPPDTEVQINDHYAALQAWHEWATNQGRLPEVLPADRIDRISTESPAPPADLSPLAATPGVWADEEQGFAPYGRLFSRLAQENEAE